MGWDGMGLGGVGLVGGVGWFGEGRIGSVWLGGLLGGADGVDVWG